ncbi:MAG UNVERIFIED_CONTAM: hypothetical protein LVT10_23780 [Anaerolineae bacterium]
MEITEGSVIGLRALRPVIFVMSIVSLIVALLVLGTAGGITNAQEETIGETMSPQPQQEIVATTEIPPVEFTQTVAGTPTLQPTIPLVEATSATPTPTIEIIVPTEVTPTVTPTIEVVASSATPTATIETVVTNDWSVVSHAEFENLPSDWLIDTSNATMRSA